MPGPDGLIYMADMGSSLIHRFDSDGTYVDSFGGRGRGPGEFQLLSSFSFSEDNRMYVYDTNGFSISRFEWNSADEDWVYADRFSIFDLGGSDSPGRIPTAIYPLNDGNLAVAYTFSFSFTLDVPEDVEPDPILIRKYSPEGELLTSYAFPAPAERMMQLDGEQGPMFIPRPFGGLNMGHISPDGYVYHNWSPNDYISIFPLSEMTEGSSNEVAKGNAALAKRLEVPLRPIPVSAQDLDEFMENIGSRSTSEIRASLPEYQPFFQSMFLESSERLFLNSFSPNPMQSTSGFIAYNPQTGLIDGFYTFGEDQVVNVAHIESGLIYSIAYDEDGMGEGRVYQINN